MWKVPEEIESVQDIEYNLINWKSSCRFYLV